MPIPTIQHAGHKYPAFQASGNAARFVKEFALEICQPDINTGYDIGFGNEDWKFHPKAIGIDINQENGYHADNLPAIQVDYIMSSHLLEHVPNYVNTLEYWHSKLKLGGVLFLYLPDMDTQSYWRPWSNRKHVTYLNPEIIERYFSDNAVKWANVFISSHDLNNSFCCIAEKI